MNKTLQAKLKTPYITVSIELNGDELVKASIIESVRKELLYEMRRQLEKKIAELSEKDLDFELLES